MPTLKEQIVATLSKRAGMTDREITDLIRGRSEAQQSVNQACRQLETAGVLGRQKRDDGRIGNYWTGKQLGSAQSNKQPLDASAERMSEDDVKAILETWFTKRGWACQIAWGRARGIDIDAMKGDQRWVIEVKGCDSRSAMRVNYFIGMLGETLQRMDDPKASYSIAVPDLAQFRGLWQRLPALAKERTTISMLFVKTDGTVEVVR